MSVTVAVLTTPIVVAAVANEYCEERVIGTRSGALTVTEYTATSSDPELCPDDSDILGRSFPYDEDKPLFVWMRLEGDVAYLNSPQSRRALEYDVRKIGDDFSFNNFLHIRHSTIEHDAAMAEAKGRDSKRFDWRFDIQFTTIPNPGEYRIRITQGGKAVCNSEGPCEIVLNVR